MVLRGRHNDRPLAPQGQAQPHSSEVANPRRSVFHHFLAHRHRGGLFQRFMKGHQKGLELPAAANRTRAPGGPPNLGSESEPIRVWYRVVCAGTIVPRRAVGIMSRRAVGPTTKTQERSGDTIISPLATPPCRTSIPIKPGACSDRPAHRPTGYDRHPVRREPSAIRRPIFRCDRFPNLLANEYSIFRSSPFQKDLDL